jgi:chaperonin GroES
MSVNIEPIADYVLAQQEEAETKTASGIFLPSQSLEKPKIAVVLAIGKDVKNVKVGSRIIYKTYSTNEIRVGNDDYILVKEEDIIATVKK